MPTFTSPVKSPAKFGDANGRYTRIESGKIPSRGRSLASSRRGKYCLAVAAAAAAAASSHAQPADDLDVQAASVVVAAKKGVTLDQLASTAGRRSVAMIMDDTSPDGSAPATSSSAALFTSHVQGIIALIGVIVLLILVQYAHISVDNATYVRGVLNMLTGLAASASAHKLSMTVAVSSLASIKSSSSSGSSKPPSAALTVAAMGLTGGQAFNLIFGSDQFFQIVAFIEAICSAIASYMAGSSIVTSQTAVNKNGTPLLELDLSQAGTLWGICALWIFALGLHAATAFANKSTIQTVRAASTESMREIVAVMHTESVYSGDKQ